MRAGRESNGKIFGGFDLVLAAAVLALVAFGIVMVYAAGSYVGEVMYGSRFYFVYKQLIGAVFGLFAAVALSTIDYHVFIKLRYPALVVSFVPVIAAIVSLSHAPP